MMRKYSNIFKRTQSWMLVLAIMLSVINPIWAMSVFAEDGDKKNVTVTIGEVIAKNYDLTDAEKGFLKSGLLIGGEITYKKPGVEDDLIEVNSDDKLVFVGNYTDSFGNEWKANSVKIVVNEEVVETVELVDGKGSYNYDKNAFSVDVEYVLDIGVDTNVQGILINAPEYIYKSLPSLKKIAEASSDLALIEAAMDKMVALATDGIEIEIDLGYGPVKAKLVWQNADAEASTLVLDQQMTKNGGKLDITVMINEYNNADSKVEYLVKNGAAMKAKVEETNAHIKNLLKPNLWGTIEDYAPEGDEKTAFLMLKDSISKVGAVFDEAVAMDWTATEKVFVKDGVTTLQFTALDSLVNLTNGIFTDVEIKNSLRVDNSVVRYNLSMYDVKVEVVLNYVNNNTIVEYPEKADVVITLAEGATRSEVLAAIEASGIENKALTVDWDGIYENGKFDVVRTELGDTLTSDVTYTITYSPKMFNVVTDYNGTAKYPYGYVVTLPSHADILKAYDYTVDGLYCAQGSEIRVLNDVNITRKEGKKYEESNYYKIVAENYLAGKGAAILNSGAIKNNESVNIRYPDNNNKIVKLNGNILNAANYPSSYQGLEWTPYSYTLSDGKVGYFSGSNTVEIQELFDNVTVTYRLTLTNFNKEDVKSAANFADVLNKEAEGQLSVLAGIAGQKGNLETLNKMMIDILGGYVDRTALHDDSVKDNALKDKYHSVLNSIIENCLAPSENLKLFEIVKEYDEASDKLYFYYKNSERVITEINSFSAYMTELLGADGQFTADEKLDALARIMYAVPDTMVSPDAVPGYLNKFTDLESQMNSYMSRLKKPNDIIDLESDKLGTLTSALQSSGSTKEIDSVEFLYLSDSTIVVISEGKVAFTATLTIEGGNNVTITSGNVNAGSVVSEGVINSFVSNLNNELVKQGIDAKYYDTDYDASILTALIGKNTNEIDKTAFEFTWTYKKYNVSVPGMEDQTVSYIDRLINLLPSSDPAYRNDYFVNGVKIGNAAVYNLTDADFEKVAAGTFNITVENVYILRENLVSYVNKLNENVGSDVAKFVLVENAKGEFSIVLKIDASAPNALTGAVMGIAQGVIQGSYPYVGIGGDGFLSGGNIYLQSIIDAIAESGFGSESIINAVNADGTTNHMILDGNVIGGEKSQLGGKLIESTMQLGNNSAETTNLAFYITIDNASEEFIQVRNVLANQLNGKFDFACKDGKFGMTLNMPEKMYEAFLAVLIVTENINLNNINDVNGEIAVTFINNMLIPLLKGDITVKTFENTAKMFGLDLNISSQPGVDSAFAGFVDFYTNANFTYDENSGTANGTVDISELIDSFGLGELGNIIAEKETGLKISINIGLENIGKEYEALFVDVGADGITNKIGLTDSVVNKLGEINGKSLIVLLDNIDGNLVINKTTVLNLNGFTVNGNLVSNGKTVVIDSYIGTDRIGTVNGNISGNAILTAGKYAGDVSGFVKNGYKQDENGIVKNQFYSIVENDGNVDIILNADILDIRTMPDAASLAIDIACDLLFNGYSSNYLELDGNTIYDISVNDLIGIYTSANRTDAVVDEVVKMIDTAELSTFINTVLDDVFDFTSISKAIANKTPVIEYGIITKPWDCEFVHVTDGDYITANITNGEEKQKTLRIYVDGSDINTEYLTELFGELGKTVSADINVNITHGKKDKQLYVEVSADANVFVDWSNPNYAVMLSVIIADGIGASENTGLVKGITEYYVTGNTAKLSREFNSLTTGQVITALKNISRDDSFEAMVERLGLASVVDADVYVLDELYNKIEKVIGFVVREADISGGSRLLGSILDSDGAYGVSKENVEKIIKRSFFNYVVSADVKVTDAYFGVKLFDENYIGVEEPEFIDGHGKPVLADNELISAYKVDYDNKYIILDVCPDGIDADIFKSMITFTANNTDNIDIAYDGSTITNEKLIKTGTVIVATASSTKTSATDVVKYTVVVLGDVNCDGYSDVADAILICRELVDDLNGNEELSGIQQLACDINNSARVDIGDATRIANKYVSKWEDYESFLGEDE